MRSAIVALLVVAFVSGCSSDSQGVVAQSAVTTPTTAGSAGSATIEPPATTESVPNVSAPADPPTTDPGTVDPIERPTTTTPTTDTPTGTGDGIGDRLYPDLGNPGIDVQHYAVSLSYEPSSRDLRGTVVVDILATADLPEFTLDELGLDVSSVTIDGDPVEFSAVDPELHVTPAAPISSGTEFAVQVEYSTQPETGRSPVTQAGWFPTETGGYTVDEPDGTRMWMPNNDHPLDKATYDFTIDVPSGLTAIANGELVSHASAGGREQWKWTQDQPMASYLTQVIVGDYVLIDTTGPHGLPLTSAVLRDDEKLMKPFIDAIPDEIAYFEQWFGPYPFDRYGIAMADSEAGLAMEEQGRSLFSREDFVSGTLGYGEELLLSHELAHQWFGDAVSPAQWQDIWLNESFATYTQWMWLDHLDLDTMEDQSARALDQRQGGGSFATGKPDVQNLFSFEVYDGGAVVLEALRRTVGDDDFFEILRTWVHDNTFAARTSADFIALAEKVSGKDLTAFFDDWLYSVDLPDNFPG